MDTHNIMSENKTDKTGVTTMAPSASLRSGSETSVQANGTKTMPNLAAVLHGAGDMRMVSGPFLLHTPLTPL